MTALYVVSSQLLVKMLSFGHGLSVFVNARFTHMPHAHAYTLYLLSRPVAGRSIPVASVITTRSSPTKSIVGP